MTLKSLQALLYRVITARPGGCPDDGLLVHLIRGDRRLSACERIKIYADAYFYRLLACLKEDFPATATVVGGSAFEDLVRGYLRRHPPTEPSLFFAGRYLPKALVNHRLSERWPFLAELAELERTLVEVFHGPDAPVLTAPEMQSVPAEHWPLLHLDIHPASRTLDCRWRVSDVLRAVESGTQWRPPGLGPVVILVWRQKTQVYYRDLEAAERAAIEAASKRANFATVCEAFTSRFDGSSAVVAINQMLARWLADGLLVRT